MASVRKLQELSRTSKSSARSEMEAIDDGGGLDPGEADANYRSAVEQSPDLFSLGRWAHPTLVHPQTCFTRPGSARIRCARSYGQFLTEVMEEHERVRSRFQRPPQRRACASRTLSARWRPRAQAEELLRRALDTCEFPPPPALADAWCHFACVLATLLEEHRHAVDEVRRAPRAGPPCGLNAPPQAEALFRRVLEASPDDVMALGNYAVFLHRAKKSYDAAEE